MAVSQNASDPVTQAQANNEKHLFSDVEYEGKQMPSF